MKILVEFDDNDHVYTVEFNKLIKIMKLNITQEDVEIAVKKAILTQ